MGKYNQLKYLKKTKARVTHECSHCEETILAGDYYYKEALKDAFLQSLNARSFYVKCYEQSHQVYKYHYEWRIEVYLVRRES